MEIDINDIDFISLRNDLKNYFGTATPYYQVAIMDVINIDMVSDIELLNIIQKTDLNIFDYIKTKRR